MNCHACDFRQRDRNEPGNAGEDPGDDRAATRARVAAQVSEARDRPAATARILVVEDEALLQLLMADNLEDLGFKAEIAGSASAEKSLVASLEGDVAAAIVDMGLPDATGDVLVGELRAIYPKLPIVVASGQSEASLLDRFKGQERVGFLTKPYAMEQLERALRSIGVVG